uniref:interferon-activable protein 205-A-like n=1 Tax=Myodes glareolus TaxID=447135 RepID=UPI002021C8A9|nr:interferon-activable protein 205-A-like [Myodes glareolus]
MSQLNIESPSSTPPADDQHQTAPSHSLDLAESLPTPAPGLTNQKTQTPSQSTTRGAVAQNEAMTVTVLDVSEQIEYESKEHEIKSMFHAKVATANKYFNVKVFSLKLKEKFKIRNVINIANYVQFKGILVINRNSSVTKVGYNGVIVVPNRTAEETLMISDINKIVCRAPFYGTLTLNKKKVYSKNTIYEMMDEGDEDEIIEVVGRGRCFNINCEKGDKLQLFDFELTRTNNHAKLVSGIHSFIKVIKVEKKENIPSSSKPE